MNAAARIGAFVALLAAIFAAAALAGSTLDPSGADDRDHAAAGDPAAGPGGHGAAMTGDPHGGLRIVPGETRFGAGRAATLRFRIAGEDGATVRDFEPEQSRLMHLIVVRRDLRRYQHLHPAQGADGAWSVRMRLPDAGAYRAYADFRTDGARHTLGIDLFVPGDFASLELPAPSRHATAGPYDVTLSESEGGELRFGVRRDGRIVTDLEPHLGARGHLVALRKGDLAYGHVHPDDASRREITFYAGATEPGTYRLFLQFRHRDVVRTVAFTREVAP